MIARELWCVDEWVPLPTDCDDNDGGDDDDATMISKSNDQCNVSVII